MATTASAAHAGACAAAREHDEDAPATHTPAGAPARPCLDKMLDAYRNGNVAGEWLAPSDDEERQFLETLFRPARIVAGNAFAPSDSSIAELVLRWGVTSLRPDRAPLNAPIERLCWLEHASWRPALTLMCHYGFLEAPDFPDHYYRRRRERARETLCGLWGIGSSSFYRLLNTAKRRLAQIFAEQVQDGRHSAGLQAFIRGEVYRRVGLDNAESRRAWHTQQAALAARADDYLAALWHWRAAGDVAAALKLIQLHLVAISRQPGLDAELEALSSDATLSQREHIEIQLAIGAVCRVRNHPDLEVQAYEQALRIASDSDDATSLGIVYSHLGKYYEPRDTDRAFACYQDSLEFLSRSQDAAEHPDAGAAYADTLVKLAWLYTLRNDPRAKSLLEKAEGPLSAQTDDTAALLQQAWGEYWRRAGAYELALEYKQRALNIYERLGDQQGMLKTYINLGVIYNDMKRYERAMEYYRRVLQMAGAVSVDPEHIAGAHLNLGACYFWLKDYASAIDQYQQALEISDRMGLQLHIGRAHYNLAEAHYTRYVLAGDPDDERQGDRHVEAAVAAWAPEGFPVYIESARKLKAELLGGTRDYAEHRILPQEQAAHYAEMTEIERNRAILQGDPLPAERIKAHLAIAQAYLSISAQEREEALRLCDRHNLRDAFAGQIDALRQTFEQSHTAEERLARAWHQATRLSEASLRHAVRRLLQDGQISKSVYAEACGVGLATASKHLVRLAEAGLVRQIGKGAGTRYVLDPA